jgi:hypothetical protein
MADANVNERKLTLVNAVACVGCYLYFEDCIGCSAKAEVCCLKNAWCCKLNTPLLSTSCCTEENAACSLGCGFCELACINATTCIKFQTQLCCIVVQGAIPCDAEMPIACAVMGLACLPGCGCCLKMEDFRDRATYSQTA